jgi:hypothetical protein
MPQFTRESPVSIGTSERTECDVPREAKRKPATGAEKEPRCRKQNEGPKVPKVLRVYVPDTTPLPDRSGTVHEGKLLKKKDRLNVSR